MPIHYDTIEDGQNKKSHLSFSKYFINDLPNMFNDYFAKGSDIHGYQTRHVNDLNLTKKQKHFSDHSVRTSGPILWNNLEEKIKSVKSVKQFRNQYKQNLISNYN